MTNEVSILLRVDGVDAVKKGAKETVAAVKQAGRELELEAAKRVAESQKIVVAMQKEAAAYGGTGDAAKSAAVFMHAEIAQREQSLETIRNAIAARVTEAQATEQTQLRMRAAMAATFAEEKRQAANAEALRAFKIKTIGDNVEAEIAAQAKIDRLHAAALAEDIAREKARTAAIIREREKAVLAQEASRRNFATGVASYAGFGVGANALGAGVGLAAGTYYASKTAIDFERATKAIEATTGSLTAARAQIQLTEKDAERLGTSVTDMALQWSKFEAASKGTSLEGAQTRDIFLGITEAAQKLNLKADQTEGVMTAITQMMSKGKVQAEELRGQLGDRLPGAFNIMARAVGVTTGELDKMMKQGGVATDEVLPAFVRELRKATNVDINTRIETTVSNFTRLTNEIKLTAAAIGSDLNPALSASAGRMAEIIRYAREHPFQASGAAALSVIPGMAGTVAAGEAAIARRDAQRQARLAYSQRNVGKLFAATPAGATFDTSRLLGSAGAAAYRAPTPTGADLLQSGGGSTDEKALARLKQKLLLLNEESQVRQVILRIREGDLQYASSETKNAELALARAEDEKKAREDAEKAGVKIGKLTDRDAERQRDAIRDQLARNDALRMELETGTSITDSQRRLLELKEKTANVSKTSLEAELATGDALEKQLDTQREISAQREKDMRREMDAEEAARREHKRNVIGAIRYSGQRRRGGGINDSYAQINSRERMSVEDENSKYGSEKSAAKAANASQKEMEALYKAHQDRLTEIKDRGEQERHDLTRHYLDAGKNALGDAAEFAQALGKKGFAAYKALSIAQTTISTYESAVDAYKSLAGIPFVGPALGVAAAAAAVAAGLARIAQIKSQTYGGGREMGGPVSRDKFYEINEKGRPEIVEANGRYWLSDTQGQVHAAKKATGGAFGGSGWSLNVENHGEPMNMRIKRIVGNVVTVEQVPAIVDSSAAAGYSRMVDDAQNNGPVTSAGNARTGLRRIPAVAGRR